MGASTIEATRGEAVQPPRTDPGGRASVLARAPRAVAVLVLVTAALAAASHLGGFAADRSIVTFLLAAPGVFLWAYPPVSRLLGPRAGAVALAISAPILALVHTAFAWFLAPSTAAAVALLGVALVGWFGRPRARSVPTELPGEEPEPFGGSRSDAFAAAVFAVAVVLPWFGAGPLGSSFDDAPEPGEASAGTLSQPLLERFVETAAAARALEAASHDGGAQGAIGFTAGDPWFAGAASTDVAAILRASWGEVLAIGPFGLGGVEAYLCFLLVALGATSFGLANGRGFAWVAVILGVSVPNLIEAGSGASLLRWGSGEARILASALAFVAAGAWLRGATNGAWRIATALPLAVAFAVDGWVAGAVLAALALASLVATAPIDRLIPLLVAAIPGLLVNAPDWPQRGTEASGFVGLGALIVVCALALVLRRRGDDRTRLALSLLVVGAAAASWAGGTEANAVLFLFASIAIAAAYDALSWGALLVGLFGLWASSDDLAQVKDASDRPSLFVDAGPQRIAVRVDPRATIDAAYAGAPPPSVYDPRWSDPTDVAEPHAMDWVALWTHLSTDEGLRALEPILLLLPHENAPRYAGGERVVLERDGRPVHEGVLLAGLDAWLAQSTDGGAGPGAAPTSGEPTPDQRAQTLEALFESPSLVGPVHRRRLEASPRPFVVPVGPEQRQRLRALERRLVELGGVELWREGEVALFGLPRSAFPVPPLPDPPPDAPTRGN